EIEDELAAAVALRVGRCGRNEPVTSPEREVTGFPARGRGDAAARLEGVQPPPLEERRGLLVDQRVPRRLGNVGDRAEDLQLCGKRLRHRLELPRHEEAR